MKLNLKALSLTCAIVWGGLMLLMGLANLIWPTYGKAFLEVVASIYPGYQAVPSFGEVIVGTVYAAVDGCIGGLVVGWLYNLLAARSSVEGG
jgi:hypothetical protein